MNRLILAVGISASGKSTYFQKWNMVNSCHDLVLSSDYLRGIIGKDDSDQTVSSKVFDFMRVMTKYTFKYMEGINVIIDATNTTRSRRKEFLDIAKAFGAKTACWCFPITMEYAKQRNAARERKVPDHVIEKQFNDMQWPIEGEVDQIVWVTSPDNHRLK